MDLKTLDYKSLKAIFKPQKERLGLEIEGGAVRIVRLEKGVEGARRIAAFGELDIDLMKASGLGVQRFKTMLKQVGGGITRVAVNMEHASLRMRKMNFAKMPERDLLEAIRWNFREHVEVPIEKYVVGFTPLEPLPEANKMAVMAFGVAQEAVAEYQARLKSMGLKPTSLEPSATALLASFYENGILADGKHHVCIEFGDEESYFIVMKKTMMLFSRPMAGVSQQGMVKHIARNLNLDEAKAKEAIDAWMKAPEFARQAAAEKAATAAAAAGTAAGALAPAASPEEDLLRRVDSNVKIFFSRLVIEAQRSIDAFCIMYGVERVDRIHICGGGVLYPGLVEHVRKTLGIETVTFNPFAGMMEPERQTPEVVARSPLFGVAVGLAIPY